MIIESNVLVPRKSLVASLSKYIKISGLYYVGSQFIKQSFYKSISIIISHLFFEVKSLGKFLSFKRQAKKYNIRIIKTKDINDKNTMKIIKNKKPDLIVSVFFNQVLEKEVIQLAKFGAINIHPAFLPNYKGVSPIFWALAKNEKYCGISVHFMDEKIDTGLIVNRKKIPIISSDTEDSLYWRCAKAGSPLLIKSIKQVFSFKTKLIKNLNGSYNSFPTKEAVKSFRKKRAFFNLKEFIFTN